MTIQERVLNVENELIALRRHFHQYPEASLKEYETAKKIKFELDKNGIRYKEIAETGVLAIIEGGKGSGKTILLRADIDALEIPEETQAVYASKNPGLSHSCGHDAHTAMGLITAKILSNIKDTFAGTVYVAFQPAEEIGAGAKQFLASGAIETIDEAFALHVRSDMPSHVVGVRPGPVNASCDIFKIEVTGESSHVGKPHASKDALVTASEIVVALQTIVAREIDPVESAVVGIGKLHAGTRYNIVANHALIEGTTRAFSHEVRAHLNEAVERISSSIAQAHRCTIDITWHDAAAPVINDKILSESAQRVAQQIDWVNGLDTTYDKSMGADDFADYQIQTPGTYVLLGTQDSARTAYGHHHEKFDIDESVLKTGVLFEVNYILERLAQ